LFIANKLCSNAPYRSVFTSDENIVSSVLSWLLIRCRRTHHALKRCGNF